MKKKKNRQNPCPCGTLVLVGRQIIPKIYNMLEEGKYYGEIEKVLWEIPELQGKVAIQIGWSLKASLRRKEQTIHLEKE